MVGHTAGMTAEDREATRAYYDEFGDAEWNPLAADVAGRVSLEVHRRFLARFVRPGARVLEVGAGPGRFTTELAALGATVCAPTETGPGVFNRAMPHHRSASERGRPH